MNASQYLAPAFLETPDDKLVGWLTEVEEEGENFLRLQRGYQDIDRAMDIIAGMNSPPVPDVQSNLDLNEIKRVCEERVATLSNLRPLWGFKTDYPEFSDNASVLNKMLSAWYSTTFPDLAIKSALQYSDVAGLGWLSPVWRSGFINAGRGDIHLDIYGPRSVKPYMIPRDNDIQRAYAVTICVETPLHEAIVLFPSQQGKLAVDQLTASWLRKGLEAVKKMWPVQRDMYGGNKEKETLFPTVFIYHTYIMDASINMTGKTLPMGQPGTSWYYEVPSYDSLIPTGRKDSAGRETYRKAGHDDARMFPLRRKIIWTKKGKLYDGPSTFLDGRVPLVPFRLNEWPWDFFGHSIIRDTESAQNSITRLARAADDSMCTALDPPMEYDRNILAQGTMEKINLRAGKQRIPSDLQMGMIARPMLSPDYYSVPATHALEAVKFLQEQIRYFAGTRDMMALAQARQLPAGDTVEKLMELAGPLITSMSRAMERSMCLLGDMWKSRAFQFYTLPRRVQVLGRDGVTEEDFDFDPGTMIPSHMPDEMEEIRSKIRAKEITDYRSAPASRYSIAQRAAFHQNSFYFHITPFSMHQITQMTRKMLFLQLYRSGFPIDSWTVAEAMDIPNFGNPPETSDGSVMGNWIAEQKIKAAVQIEIQQAIEQTQMAAGLQGAITGATGGANGAETRGRKPTASVPPALQSKDGGTRQTVRESPR